MAVATANTGSARAIPRPTTHTRLAVWPLPPTSLVTTKAMAASCQSWMNITTTRPMSDRRSLPRLVRAFDTAVRIILMSYVKREISLPDDVAWKKPRSMRARWANKRLPAEAEWERAARGGRVDEEFPWGDQPVSTDLANYAAGGHGETMSIGSYPPNGYGLQDMSGNVWEYCLDEWQPDYTGRSPLAANDKEQAGLEFLSVRTRRVIRGGSWSGLPVNLRVAWRDSHPPGGAGDHVGFRCVASLAPE